MPCRRYCTPNVRHDREFLPECDDPFGCLPEALVIFPVYADPPLVWPLSEPTHRRRCGSAEALRSTRTPPRLAPPRAPTPALAAHDCGSLFLAASVRRKKRTSLCLSRKWRTRHAVSWRPLLPYHTVALHAVSICQCHRLEPSGTSGRPPAAVQCSGTPAGRDAGGARRAVDWRQTQWWRVLDAGAARSVCAFGAFLRSGSLSLHARVRQLWLRTRLRVCVCVWVCVGEGGGQWGSV